MLKVPIPVCIYLVSELLKVLSITLTYDATFGESG